MKKRRGGGIILNNRAAEKERIMTRNEAVKKTIRRKKNMIIALALIAVGLVLVVTAVILEANNYPWGILFGTATQDADEIPDPPPIELDAEDQEAELTAAVPSEEVTETAAVSESPEIDTSPEVEAELPGNTEATESAPAVPQYIILGTFKIPVLKVSQNLLEGAGRQMKYGVGHVPLTAAPGQKGNCVVSGHRPYPFRYLDQLKQGDSIVIKAEGVTYTYVVYESFDVLPTETWVLNQIPGEDYTLTVITCTPYMVSSHRLIVRARLTDIDGKTPQEYHGDIIPEVSASPEAADGTVPVEAAPSETSAASVADPLPEPEEEAIESVPVSPE